jgi:hypothetical protein
MSDTASAASAASTVRLTAPSGNDVSKASELVKWLAGHARYIGALAQSAYIVLDALTTFGAALRDACKVIADKYYRPGES